MLTQCRATAPLAGLPALMLLVLATGCGKPAVVEVPPPVSVTLAVTASAASNPDADGRPSPLAVRVLQLADAAAFNEADLNAVWSDEATTLAAVLVSRQEFMLSPGAAAQGSLTLDPRTRYLGVVAAFRNFRHATWRTVLPVPQASESGTAFVLTVAADVAAVSARIEPAAEAGAEQ